MISSNLVSIFILFEWSQRILLLRLCFLTLFLPSILSRPIPCPENFGITLISSNFFFLPSTLSRPIPCPENFVITLISSNFFFFALDSQ